MVPQQRSTPGWQQLEADSNNPAIFQHLLQANAFSSASPPIDRALLQYLSQQITQVQSLNSSESDFNRFSKSSACSVATSSAVNGMSPSGVNGLSPSGMSPTTSMAGPLLDCHAALGTSTQSPTSTAYTQDPRLAKVSDRTSLTCGSPAYDSNGQCDSSPQDTSCNGTCNDAAAGDVGGQGPNRPCPTSIVVSSHTDATQAAGLINFSLSQPGVSSFVLVAQLGPSSSPGSQATLCTALRVAITARRIHISTAPPTDLAIMPVFSNMPSSSLGGGDVSKSDGGSLQGGPGGDGMIDCADIHVYQVAAGLAPAPGTTRQLRVDPGSHPMLLALHLAQAVLGGGPQGDGVLRAIEVVFGPAAARLALHTLTHAHCHMTAAGHEALLLPSQAEGGASTSHFSVYVVPSALAPQQAHAAARAAMDAQAMQRLLAAAGPAAGQHNGLHNLYAAYPNNPDGSGMMHSGFSRLSNDSLNGFNPAFNMLGSMGQGGAQYGLHNALSLPLGVADVIEAAAGAGAAAAVAAANSAAMAQHKAGHQQHHMQQAGGSSSGAGTSSILAQARPRARKADWVIVTEDTAIKNAAGAVAKVLGRMALQGLCCPVFMERKTARYTAVVSVAVKAIAVARGYVHNEGSGHEVGFQPYIRGDASACAFGAARPPGAPSASAAEAARSESLNGRLSSQLLSSLAAGDITAMDLLQVSRMAGGSPLAGMSPRGGSPPLRGGSPPLRGASPPLRGGSPPTWATGDVNGGSGGSSVCGDDEMAGQWADMEQAELAFDVYKIVLQQEVSEGNNLPVKVTAHSRPGVVSSIISKLVIERQSAVLITAGGRAMHVAMLAVVAARQRLQSQGVDILLLPKFVTVDTTQTLGWESVFLKFSIIKWSPAAALAAELSTKLAINHRNVSDPFARTSV